jgi:hypothetical protein
MLAVSSTDRQSHAAPSNVLDVVEDASRDLDTLSGSVWLGVRVAVASAEADCEPALSDNVTDLEAVTSDERVTVDDSDFDAADRVRVKDPKLSVPTVTVDDSVTMVPEMRPDAVLDVVRETVVFTPRAATPAESRSSASSEAIMTRTTSGLVAGVFISFVGCLLRIVYSGTSTGACREIIAPA